MTAHPALEQERREVPELRIYGEPDEEVEAVLQSYRELWGRQDTAGLIELHADDVEWINAFARILRGSETLGDFLGQRLFPAFPRDVSREEAARMQTISIRYLGDDAAVAHLFTEGRRGAPRSPDEDRRRTHIHLVLEKRGADWKIVHTAIMDAR